MMICAAPMRSYRIKLEEQVVGAKKRKWPQSVALDRTVLRSAWAGGNHFISLVSGQARKWGCVRGQVPRAGFIIGVFRRVYLRPARPIVSVLHPGDLTCFGDQCTPQSSPADSAVSA